MSGRELNGLFFAMMALDLGRFTEFSMLPNGGYTAWPLFLM